MPDEANSIVSSTMGVVVVQECAKGHTTAYAVDGVSFDDAMMGTKVLDPHDVCSWFDCGESQFTMSALYKAEIRHA